MDAMYFTCLLVMAAVVAVPSHTASSIRHKQQASPNDLLLYERLKTADTSFGCSFPHYFRCQNGACVDSIRTCDGTVDCPDGSDETHHLCRTRKCPYYNFRCTYGACVDGTAVCDGARDCADNSDELQHRCSTRRFIEGDSFVCDNGQRIYLTARCDGVVDCADASDETLGACAGVTCPAQLFQCEYGACVAEHAVCDGVYNCADGSDESDALCRWRLPRIATTSTTTTTVGAPQQSGVMCVAPPHPAHGLYLSYGQHEYVPGALTDLLYLNATCQPGYTAVGNGVFCYNGYWSKDYPICVLYCEVERSPRVTYRCLITEYRNAEGTRDCEEREPENTVMEPRCRLPHYSSAVELPYMYCLNGKWSYTPKCEPKCGTVTPQGVPLILGGEIAKWGDVPWYVDIYWKVNDTYFRRICGAVLVAENAAFSSAHCFYDEASGRLHPAERFAVAAGMQRSQWDHPANVYAQKSNVKNVFIPRFYRGARLNFADDFAYVEFETEVELQANVSPACLSFDDEFIRSQLREGSIGMVAGAGLTAAERGSEAGVLRMLRVPYVSFQECMRRTPPEYAEYLSGGKFCAGYTNGTTLSKGDSGSAVVFPFLYRGMIRYFVLGIASTSPSSRDGSPSDLFSLVSFEPVHKHSKLIKRHWRP